MCPLDNLGPFAVLCHRRTGPGPHALPGDRVLAGAVCKHHEASPLSERISVHECVVPLALILGLPRRPPRRLRLGAGLGLFVRLW